MEAFARAATLRVFTLLCALLAAGAAEAVPTAWAGTLTVEFVDPGLADARVTGVGVAAVHPLGGGAALETLGIAGGITGTVTVPRTGATPGSILSARVDVSLGTGSLGPFQPPAPLGQPQLTRNALPVRGSVRLCVLSAGCAFGPDLVLTTNDGSTGVGVGGLLTVGGVGALRVSVQAAPWTVDTAYLPVQTQNGAVFSLPRSGYVHGPFSFATGSTALPGGELQLVTPMAVTSQQGETFASFGVLTLRFLPEPGFIALLTSGVMGLLVLAWTRRQP